MEAGILACRLAPGENGLQAAKIRIGTRGSPLALAQARQVAARLGAAHGLAPEQCELVIIKTTGDKITDRPLIEAGGKGLFTKELEEALFAGDIDLAVHSMKDMPAILPQGLAISAILEREDPRDAFVSLKYPSLDAMPEGAVIGTSSPRRQAQVLRARPDLRVVGFRGNVETRLRKLEEGVADATFLACAGLNRLGLSQHITAAMADRRDAPGRSARRHRHRDPRRRRSDRAADRAAQRCGDGTCASPPNAPTWRSSKARAAPRSQALPS